MGDSLSYLNNLLSLRNTTSTYTATSRYLQILVKILFIVFDTLQYSYSYFTLFLTLIKLLTLFTILVQLLYTIYDTNTTTLHCLRYEYTNFTLHQFSCIMLFAKLNTDHFSTYP